MNIRAAVGDATTTVVRRLWDLDRRMRLLQEAVGRIEDRQLQASQVQQLAEAEFRVYSQWGEDGIIQHLVREVNPTDHRFVEFGVEDYEEACTRYLLVNNNWSGLVLDGDADAIRRIRQSQVYWRYNLKAEHAFITRDNINDLIGANGMSGEIGLLVIDIDGMDYWIWQAIQVVRPAIVICEYNHLFGPTRAVTVPYDAQFARRQAHHALIYYGASLPALCKLADQKGYAFVGAGSAGLNAFFVRRDRLPSTVTAVDCEQGFIEGKFCEVHSEQGERLKLTRQQQQDILSGLPLVEV